MCGIAGFISREGLSKEKGLSFLNFMNGIQEHRGPDGRGVWQDATGRVGLAHVRLSILDLSQMAAQPMESSPGHVITYNGEIYNFLELRHELGEENFRTRSDTEIILKAYEKWGESCVDHFRWMFAFAIWDRQRQKLFIARDPFGIKPFYYTIQKQIFYFASEIKTLLPFLDRPKVHLAGLRDYFTFQFCLGEKTLFEGIQQLQPAHCGTVDRDLKISLKQYWEVHYRLDWGKSEEHFLEEVRKSLVESITLHLRSDVEVGAYLSGGLDSSLIVSLARELRPQGRFQAFVGKFSFDERFDESRYAGILAREKNLLLHEVDISEQDFVDQMAKVIYHLDQPVAGPGSFPQFMVSKAVRDHVKVVLGGQGGDEVFGGYARYLIAYFEQCIKGAIEGTMDQGKFIVTYESIISNLRSLENYKPLIQEFWAEGIFDSRDQRYFRLINRANGFNGVINWKSFGDYSSFDDFHKIYWGENVEKESYFDSMTHFDFKTLLPALLQVEDRMSMAHGVESRVPFLYLELVTLLATIPSNIKFQNGELKRLLKTAFSDKIPQAILERKDKMGFPVPLQTWMRQKGKARDFILDTLRGTEASRRFYLADGLDPESLIENEGPFGRNIWALLNLELWQQQFLDHPIPFKESEGAVRGGKYAGSHHRR